MSGPAAAASTDWTPLRVAPELGFTVGDPGSTGRTVRSTAVVPASGWPDTVLDAVSLDAIEVRAASVRGLLHRARHTPRQDSYSLGASGDPLVITVCDGVGSLGLSHLAARHVTERMPELVAARAGDGSDTWPSVFGALSDELVVLGGPGAATDARTGLATTATVAVLRPEAAGVSAELAWVGDSPAYLLRDRRWHLLTAAKSIGADGVASTRVDAIPGPVVLSGTTRVDLVPGDLFVVMSDGISDPLGTGAGLVGGALAEWWAEPVDALEFATQVGFKRRGFIDDRTAVAVWVSPRPAGPDPSAQAGVGHEHV